ncbi:hypothetical protein [Nostoc sp.]|uniref:hypothetical protein n=1 Tax=Nostoc sp. TaxID=1180 RepID=UPI002FF185F6
MGRTPTGILLRGSVSKSCTVLTNIQTRLENTRYRGLALSVRAASRREAMPFAVVFYGYSREQLLTMTVHDIDPNFPAET